MSTPVMGLVWKSDVGPASKRLVLLALADNASEAGYCWPGIEYLVGKTGLSRASVYRILSELEDDQLIARRERRRPNGTQRSNVYRINLKLLSERERPTSKEEREEVASFAELFEKPQVKRRVAQRDSEKPQVTTGSHHETDRVSPRDRQGLTTRPPQGLTMRPLEPSPEPSMEPSVEPPRAPQRASVDEPFAEVVIDPEDAAAAHLRSRPSSDMDEPPGAEIESIHIARQLQRNRRRSDNITELAKNAYVQESMPIVDRFEQRTNRLSLDRRRKWCSAVTNLIKLGYSEEVIDAAMDLCIAEGVGWGLLEDKALIVANRQKAAARAPRKPSVSEQRRVETESLRDRMIAKDAAEAAAQAQLTRATPRAISGGTT